MNKYNYFPILKTTDAEMKGYLNLEYELKKNILPIFELTRSRRSKKKNPHGDITKSISKIMAAANENSFILDLTTEPMLSNPQISDMLNDHSNGFNKWCAFIRGFDSNQVVPVIHFDPDDLPEVKKQIKNLEETSKYLAFRIDIYEPNIIEFVKTVIKYMKNSENLIIILDAGFVHILKQNGIVNKYVEIINNIFVLGKYKMIICSSSGFPQSVTTSGYGGKSGDSTGEFDIVEVLINDEIKKNFKNEENKNIYHGDYASVHPIRYNTGGGSWVPRIDVPLDKKYFYYRYRHEDGSYEKAAEEIINDPRYAKIKGISTWGDDEIIKASQGNPSGRNPAHWIAVRINLHITRQFIRLKKEQLISL